MPAITPNYLTVDAAGKVNALFTGHVRASGIDLPLNIAGQTPPAPATQILWSPGGIGDASATAPDGSIFAGQDAQGLVNLDVAMRGLATSQGRNARSGLQLNELTGGKAQVSVYAGPSGLALPLWSRKILDSDGNSDFDSYGAAADALAQAYQRPRIRLIPAQLTGGPYTYVSNLTAWLQWNNILVYENSTVVAIVGSTQFTNSSGAVIYPALQLYAAAASGGTLGSYGSYITIPPGFGNTTVQTISTIFYLTNIGPINSTTPATWSFRIQEYATGSNNDANKLIGTNAQILQGVLLLIPGA